MVAWSWVEAVKVGRMVQFIFKKVLIEIINEQYERKENI
jgi:hypothetical protein